MALAQQCFRHLDLNNRSFSSTGATPSKPQHFSKTITECGDRRRATYLECVTFPIERAETSPKASSRQQNHNKQEENKTTKIRTKTVDFGFASKPQNSSPSCLLASASSTYLSRAWTVNTPTKQKQHSYTTKPWSLPTKTLKTPIGLWNHQTLSKTGRHNKNPP